MTDRTMSNDLNDVKQHAKDAARSSLLAVRTAVDFALGKLGAADAEAPAQPSPETSDSESTPPQPPPFGQA